MGLPAQTTVLLVALAAALVAMRLPLKPVVLEFPAKATLVAHLKRHITLVAVVVAQGLLD